MNYKKSVHLEPVTFSEQFWFGSMFVPRIVPRGVGVRFLAALLLCGGRLRGRLGRGRRGGIALALGPPVGAGPVRPLAPLVAVLGLLPQSRRPPVPRRPQQLVALQAQNSSPCYSQVQGRRATFFRRKGATGFFKGVHAYLRGTGRLLRLVRRRLLAALLLLVLGRLAAFLGGQNCHGTELKGHEVENGDQPKALIAVRITRIAAGHVLRINSPVNNRKRCSPTMEFRHDSASLARLNARSMRSVC